MDSIYLEDYLDNAKKNTYREDCTRYCRYLEDHVNALKEQNKKLEEQNEKLEKIWRAINKSCVVISNMDRTMTPEQVKKSCLERIFNE